MVEGHEDGTTRWCGGQPSLGVGRLSDTIWEQVRRSRRQTGKASLLGSLCLFGMPAIWFFGWRAGDLCPGEGIAPYLIVAGIGVGLWVGPKAFVAWMRWWRVRRDAPVELFGRFAVGAPEVTFASGAGLIVARHGRAGRGPEPARVVVTATPGPVEARHLNELERIELDVLLRARETPSGEHLFYAFFISIFLGSPTLGLLLWLFSIELPRRLAYPAYYLSILLDFVIIVAVMVFFGRRRNRVVRTEADGELANHRGILLFPKSGLRWQVGNRPSKARLDAPGLTAAGRDWRKPKGF